MITLSLQVFGCGFPAGRRRASELHSLRRAPTSSAAASAAGPGLAWALLELARAQILSSDRRQQVLKSHSSKARTGVVVNW
ncbi:hypothetical protein, partial [Mesorhizobium sp. M4B.F.Ca.ET.013.02.1.1]|uniref:hypothetical protein n=1 Tax=Mesorhizobium sp. M4B.F.Ca.ET.013.02.1.1 TaxID=2496755 RepID=UPI001AECC670